MLLLDSLNKHPVMSASASLVDPIQEQEVLLGGRTAFQFISNHGRLDTSAVEEVDKAYRKAKVGCCFRTIQFAAWTTAAVAVITVPVKLLWMYRAEIQDQIADALPPASSLPLIGPVVGDGASYVFNNPGTTGFGMLALAALVQGITGRAIILPFLETVGKAVIVGLGLCAKKAGDSAAESYKQEEMEKNVVRGRTQELSIAFVNERFVFIHKYLTTELKNALSDPKKLSDLNKKVEKFKEQIEVVKRSTQLASIPQHELQVAINRLNLITDLIEEKYRSGIVNWLEGGDSTLIPSNARSHLHMAKKLTSGKVRCLLTNLLLTQVATTVVGVAFAAFIHQNEAKKHCLSWIGHPEFLAKGNCDLMTPTVVAASIAITLGLGLQLNYCLTRSRNNQKKIHHLSVAKVLLKELCRDMADQLQQPGHNNLAHTAQERLEELKRVIKKYSIDGQEEITSDLETAINDILKPDIR